MKKIIYRLNYFHAPVMKKQTGEFLMLESIRNKVWNPVFTVGAITFFLSMTLRGFFNQTYAVIPLGISTLVLFSGIWILSATALVVFDKNESKIYFIYKHLGYLQKIYVYPLTSVDEVIFQNPKSGKAFLGLQKDDGHFILIAKQKSSAILHQTAKTVSGFLGLNLQENG